MPTLMILYIIVARRAQRPWSLLDILVECEAYDAPRCNLFARLVAAAPEYWAAFNAVQSVEDKAWMLLDDDSWQDGFVADYIAPYVYECWQLRKDAKLTACNRSDERGADGSDAMV